ncbi:hypothetical protein WICPIJ_009293 [Wickerhamomyces pijperi]|uniref:Prenylcysteine lyase domain-containing protein n=1 Tax=Wickerhamomyces pijperi TaxID=599730 RepID=A0A9P8TE98_WICPI|nr:hypothetical protein WICPIJ_009293 [Wickerhamomyces pijperi]
MIEAILYTSLFLLLSLVSARESDSLGKIAIIGAGAGGSSAAHHLQKFTDKGFNITIFEKNHYIGGRSTTVGNLQSGNAGNESTAYGDYELGASIFTSDNVILTNAVQDFNLSVYDPSVASDNSSGLFNDTTGAWNGDSYVYYYYYSDEQTLDFQSNSSVQEAEAQEFSQIETLVGSIIDAFVESYYYDEFPYTGLTNITEQTQLSTLTGTYALDLLKSLNVTEGACRDFIEPNTRVNYASNIDQITTLEALVSSNSASNVYSVVGGNYQIFERFIEQSGAALKLNTSVNRIKYVTKVKRSDSYYLLEVIDHETGNLTLEKFDKVIIAAPFYQSNIEVNIDLKETLPGVQYRDLYVSLIRSKVKINNAALNQEIEAPENLLTTSINSDGLPNGVPYYSMTVKNYNTETGEYIYKLFTPEAIDSQFILSNFFNDVQSFEIILQHYWNPYPYSTPLTEFPDFQIDVHGGLYYLNTMEQFISTMETSALAGANVAGLISAGRNTTVIGLPDQVDISSKFV